MRKFRAMRGRGRQVENTVSLIVLFLMIIMAEIRAERENRLVASACGTSPPNNATLFALILNASLTSVAREVGSSGFATADQEGSTETATDSVYVLAQCRKDFPSADCVNCIQAAHNQIRNCSSVSARAFYDDCYLRYESFNFYDVYTDSTQKQLCGILNNTTNSTLFSDTARSLVTDLCTVTPQIDAYFAAAQTRQGSSSNTTIYGLAFCLRSIQRDSCQTCLNTALQNINKCFPGPEGRAIDAGCYLRYDFEPFFPSNATIELTQFLRRGKKEKWAVWIISGAVGGVFILGLIICLHVFRKRKQDVERAMGLREPRDFDFKTMKKATNNFHEENKLGQGGFAQVFKGTLKDGKVVAVKKLTLDGSPHVISEFESEVKLISDVHHKNLLRLLGCCRQGQERLLIYEYMPNSSLDRILFGKSNEVLSWKKRLNIIVGTARGLAYLHEEFHVCIIHRDIKSSNILLDENFEAKLADFGLARRLPDDKLHLSTRFAGTLGYTAPEYAGQGKLTEKADTYSFGVVVFEILSGRKSIDHKQPPHMQYLIQLVWRLYEDNKVLEIVGSEREMEGFIEEEALRVINIALLCIQASARDRPSMSEVLTLLTQDDINLQKLLQPPPFIDAIYQGDGRSSTFSSTSTAMITESLGAR